MYLFCVGGRPHGVNTTMRTHVSVLGVDHMGSIQQWGRMCRCWRSTTWGQYNNEDACVGVGGRPHGVNTTMRTHVSVLEVDHMGSIQQ